MKPQSFLLLPLILGLSLTAGFGQSRRVGSPDEPAKKANRRPAAQNKDAGEPIRIDAETIVDDESVIELNTDLITIPVKVRDRKGRFVAGLTKENFQVTEDGREQEIAHFSNEQEPFTVALVLDMSYSSTFKIQEIQRAALAFIDQLREGDKVMVVAFDEEVRVLSQPTSDRRALAAAIKNTRIASGTSLHDALNFVINQKFKRLGGRKAIVLFTDGVDTTSREATAAANLRDALELDALIYPIRYDTFNDVQAIKNRPIISQQRIPIPTTGRSPFPVPTMPTVVTPDATGTSAEDYRRAEEFLNDVSYRTGGRIFLASTASNLTKAFAGIALELRGFYSLGYYPAEETATGKTRKLKVKVDQPNVAVEARDSYVIRKKEK